MFQPDELKKEKRLLWSRGTGTDVWRMFCAAMSGDVKTLDGLLQHDPSLARCQYAYRTPLYFAVRENQIDAAALLLDRGTDAIGLPINDTLVEIAGDRGYSAMKALLEVKLEAIHNTSKHGEPVAAAIRERDLGEVRSLLDAAPELLHKGDRRSNQPIHWAVMTRQIEMIDELLGRKADINAERQDGARPIQLASGDYHFRGWRDVPEGVASSPAEVVAHLRARGADCGMSMAACLGDEARVRELLAVDPALANRVDRYVTYYQGSGSPLRNAAGGGHLSIVKLLLDSGADPNQPEEGIAPRGHALYAAVYHGHFEIARELLERGAFPSPPVESSADALTIAIKNKNQPLIELLCSYGAARGVNILGYYGDVVTAAAVFAANPALADDLEAFENAAEEGHESFIRLMLRYRGDLARRTAVAGKTRELSELLFAHGMNPSQPDWLGITPLHRIARRGAVDDAELFIDHGADLNARDDDLSSTPLAWAAKFGKAEMVQLLLSRGAKPNLPDDPSWATPLAWATRGGHDEIVRLLEQAGAG